MADQFARIGMDVIEDIINGNTKNLNGMREREAERQKNVSDSLTEEREIRMKKMPEWVKIASRVVDKDLIEDYKDTLTNFIMSGPGTGELMDITMAVLEKLYDSNMENAAEMLSLAQDGMDVLFVQSMAYQYSDKGPNFVALTLDRELTPEEKLRFSFKKMEIERRKISRLEAEYGRAVN